MAVYFRFKHSTDTESIPVDDVFITVRDLTRKIIEAKKLTRSNYGVYGLLITNPVTGEDYVDEETLIQRSSTVLVRQVPWPGRRPPLTLVVGQKGEDGESSNASNLVANSTTVGGDLSGRAMGGGFSVPGRPAPPEGYVCHRCRIPGHYIQHCPTNRDPDYDIKRVKPPCVEVSQENEAAFDRGELEGLPSKRPVVDFPPELHCPLCKQVFKYAMVTSKCCLESFCDQCIREHIITKARCVCGATGTLADYLMPNQTVRDLIISMLESGFSGGKNGVSFCISSSTEDQKAASKEQKLSSSSEASTVPPETHGSHRNGYSEPKATPIGKRCTDAAAISTEDQEAASKKQKLSSSPEASTIASETHGDPTNGYWERKATSTGKRVSAAVAATATSAFESNDDYGHFKRRRTSNYNFLRLEGQREQACLVGC